MTEAWIDGYKYFWNVSFTFDQLEPYSTISILAIGGPTFMVAAYVYITLLRNPAIRGKAYFSISIALGFIDCLAFLTNLVRYRLSLFSPFDPFFASLEDGAGATALCVLALSMTRAQLVAQCLLSTNRLLAVSRPLDYDRWQSTFTRVGFILMIIIPTIVAIPDLLNGFFFGTLYGVHGRIIFYSTANKSWSLMMNVSDYVATAFQFSLTIFAFVCNCVLIAIVATKKGAMKTAGTGLVVTTLAQFLTHLAYAIIMVCFLYFPPPLKNALMFTTISLDAISILPIWLLLAFSSTVREAVFPRKIGSNKTTDATLSVVMVVGAAP